MRDMPVLRLTLEGMTYQIVQAFSNHEIEVRDYIAEYFKNADVGQLVLAQVQQELPRLVRDAVQQAIKTTLYETMRDEKVATVLQQQVRKAVFVLLEEK